MAHLGPTGQWVSDYTAAQLREIYRQNLPWTVWNAAQVARALRISPACVRRCVQTGKLPGTQEELYGKPGQYRIHLTDVLIFAREHGLDLPEELQGLEDPPDGDSTSGTPA